LKVILKHHIIFYVYICTFHVYVVSGFLLRFSCVRRAVYVVVRLMFGAVGFHRVRTVGEQATRQQAPVLAVAPHSSFYDGLAAVVTDGPTIVAKEENSFIPIVGSTRRSASSLYILQAPCDIIFVV